MIVEFISVLILDHIFVCVNFDIYVLVFWIWMSFVGSKPTLTLRFGITYYVHYFTLATILRINKSFISSLKPYISFPF